MNSFFIGNLNFPLRSAFCHFWKTGNVIRTHLLSKTEQETTCIGPNLIRLQQFTLMVSSEMASCLYCVPYHSSVLSVCPSYDFETTATLGGRKKTTRSHYVKWNIPVCHSWVDTVEDHSIIWNTVLLFASCLDQDHVGDSLMCLKIKLTNVFLEFLITA